MKTSSIQVLTRVPVSAPRGAEWAARAVLGLQRAAQWAWRVMEAHGQRRGRHEMQLLAEHWESFDPALAQRMREAARFEAT
jgi:hypothetical protein